MIILLAIILVIHGVAHLVGFVVPWKISEIEEMPYTTKILNNSIDVGEVGIRIIGIIWLMLAILFFGTAVGVIFQYEWWRLVVNISLVISFLMCIVGLPDSKFGILINILILAAIIAGKPLGWF